MKEESLADMVGYDDSTAYITSSFTPSSPGLPQSAINGAGVVSTTTGVGSSSNQGRYSISANSLLAEKLMAASVHNHNNNNNSQHIGTEASVGLPLMGQQRPAGKPPDSTKGRPTRNASCICCTANAELLAKGEGDEQKLV